MQYIVHVAFGICVLTTIFNWSKKILLVMVPAIFIATGFREVIDYTDAFTIINSAIAIVLKYLSIVLTILAAFEDELKPMLIKIKEKRKEEV